MPEIVAGSLVLLMVLSQISYFFDRCIFAHDDLSQLSTYYLKLATEGRWLNYIIFPVIRYFDIKIALIASFIFITIFGYICARGYASTTQSILIALLIILTPSIANLLDWPLTALPTLFLLSIASLTYKKLPHWLFFIIFGILFNATLSNFYFLLLLFFLGEDNKKIVLILLFWVVGYIIGFCVAELMTWLLCGHFIKLADWRDPHYIKSFQDVILNGKKIVQSFVNHIRYLGKIGIYVMICAIISFLYQFKCKKKRGLILASVIGVVIMSVYAQSLTAGLYVSLRTSHNLYIGIFLAILVTFARYRYFFIIAVIILAGRCMYMNAQDLNYHNEIRKTFCESIRTIETDTTSVEGIILIIDSENDMQDLAKYIAGKKKINYYHKGAPFEKNWIRAAQHVGYNNVWTYEDARKKLDELDCSLELINFNAKGFYRYALFKNHLIVTLNPIDGKIK